MTTRGWLWCYGEGLEGKTNLNIGNNRIEAAHGESRAGGIEAAHGESRAGGIEAAHGESRAGGMERVSVELRAGELKAHALNCEQGN